MDDTAHPHGLFGGKLGWSPDDWVASDDRVRGGKSQSHLSIDAGQATFCGHLDIKTLGGAGFASQRTTGADRHWDLSPYAGLLLVVDASKSDHKSYTLILKDEILPKDATTGREQATTSWEFDFDISTTLALETKSKHHHRIFIPWAALTPTYRGKPKDPGRDLKIHDIRRMSLMMRSHFGAQHGDFKLCIDAIWAVARAPQHSGPSPDTSTSTISVEKAMPDQTPSQSRSGEAPPTGMVSRLLACLGRL